MTESRRHFIHEIIDRDLASGKHRRVVTRFPPEPNGYLHIGHAKSICLNFGLAEQYGGRCHLRMDDTNPATEDMEYVEAIERDVRWLGFDWGAQRFHASDYFERLYDAAVELIGAGKAYVDSLSEEEIRAGRGTVTEPGEASPYRSRSVEENLDLFGRMRAGEFADGDHVLRAKIDMASPNMKMRDPLLYRIRRGQHYRTGDAWCIYPLYDFTHCLSDAFEGITHSLCTLEFENNRELYDWILDQLHDWLSKKDPSYRRPQQIEFARLNLSYTMMSKRKLRQLVEEGHVSGWDDPRMPTLAAIRRRGITPGAIRALCDMVGVAKHNSTVDLGKLDYCIREDLDDVAPRVMCVLQPLEVVIENVPEGETEPLEAPLFPPDVGKEGQRELTFGRTIYIERDDFMREPPQGYHRLSPGAEVRLRYGYVVACVDFVENDEGEVVKLLCRYDPETRGGHTDRKVKGTIHWVNAETAVPVTVRLYDRLFQTELPEDLDDLNPASLVERPRALLEPWAAEQVADEIRKDNIRDVLGYRVTAGTHHFQFERQGYFVLDPDSTSSGLVFNRTVTLRDTWAKVRKGGAQPEPKRRRKPQPPAAPQATEVPPDVRAGAEALQRAHGIGEEDALRLAREPSLEALFASAVSAGAVAGPAARWIVNDVAPLVKTESLRFGGAELARLVGLVEAGTISATAGKEVLSAMAETGDDPDAIVERLGLERVGRGAVARAIDAVLERHPDELARYRSGEKKLFGFFIGQVMRQTQGRANAKEVRALLSDKLG